MTQPDLACRSGNGVGHINKVKLYTSSPVITRIGGHR